MFLFSFKFFDKGEDVAVLVLAWVPVLEAQRHQGRYGTVAIDQGSGVPVQGPGWVQGLVGTTLPSRLSHPAAGGPSVDSSVLVR